MNNLTPGESFLIRRKPVKKNQETSRAILFFILAAAIAATVFQFEILPTMVQSKSAEVSLLDKTSNEDVCRDLMAGRYSATVDIYKYCNAHGVR